MRLLAHQTLTLRIYYEGDLLEAITGDSFTTQELELEEECFCILEAGGYKSIGVTLTWTLKRGRTTIRQGKYTDNITQKRQSTLY